LIKRKGKPPSAQAFGGFFVFDFLTFMPLGGIKEPIGTPDFGCWMPREANMKFVTNLKLMAIFFGCLALSACATDNLVSDLYSPNFGLRELNPNENVDARLLQNGLYLPKPFAPTPYAASPFTPSCVTAEYRCAQQAQSSWSSFDP
jgi:hypothetical protein